MKYAELRRAVEQLEWELSRADEKLRHEREYYALRLKVAQQQIDALMDPIVRAKMMEPPPPIIIQAPKNS